MKATPEREANPLKFRNFVHRLLLEFHFECYAVGTDAIEIIFDRFEMSEEAFRNLEKYLRDNWNLPTFKYITHADSIYCEALQLTGQLVNAVKDVKLGQATPALVELLNVMPIKDVT